MRGALPRHRPGAAGFMTSGGTESILMAVKAARERARAERGIDAPEMVVADSAHAAFHKAAHDFGVQRAHGARARRLPRRRRRDGGARERQHRARRRIRAAVPAGRHRPDSRAGRRSRRRVGASMHVDACMGGFVLPFMELNGDTVPPWDFRVAGRHDDLGRHPQARLRAEGRVGDPAPQQGAAALPDVRVRRLARRPLRVAEHAGLARRAADGDRVGRDAQARHRRLPAADAAHDRHARGASSPACARSPDCACSANRKRTCSRSARDGVDVFALGDALHGAGLVPRPPGAARLAAPDGEQRATRRSSTSSWPTSARASTRSAAPAPTTAARTTRRSSDDERRRSRPRRGRRAGRRVPTPHGDGVGARRARARRRAASTRCSCCTASRAARSTGATCSTRCAPDRRVDPARLPRLRAAPTSPTCATASACRPTRSRRSPRALGLHVGRAAHPRHGRQRRRRAARPLPRRHARLRGHAARADQRQHLHRHGAPHRRASSCCSSLDDAPTELDHGRRVQGRARGHVLAAQQRRRRRARGAVAASLARNDGHSLAAAHDPLHRGPARRRAPLHRRDRDAPVAARRRVGRRRPGRRRRDDRRRCSRPAPTRRSRSSTTSATTR